MGGCVENRTREAEERNRSRRAESTYTEEGPEQPGSHCPPLCHLPLLLVLSKWLWCLPTQTSTVLW